MRDVALALEACRTPTLPEVLDGDPAADDRAAATLFTFSRIVQRSAISSTWRYDRGAARYENTTTVPTRIDSSPIVSWRNSGLRRGRVVPPQGPRAETLRVVVDTWTSLPTKACPRGSQRGSRRRPACAERDVAPTTQPRPCGARADLGARVDRAAHANPTASAGSRTGAPRA